MTVAPARTTKDIPFTLDARIHADQLPPEDVINAYHTPEVITQGSDGDYQVRTYGTVLLKIDPLGRVFYAAHRAERPFADPERCVRTFDQHASTISRGGLGVSGGPRIARPDRPASPGRKGSRKGGSGSQHPATAKELLERCRHAYQGDLQLIVTELPNKGGHYKITAPEGWRYPETSTSGEVRVSLSNHARNIKRNSSSVRSELGIDLREIDPREAKREARRAARPEPESAEAVVVESEPVESESTDPAPVPEHVTSKDPADIKLRYINKMEKEGWSRADIAELMGTTPGALGVFISRERRLGNPHVPKLLRQRKKDKAEPTTREADSTKADESAAVKTRPGTTRHDQAEAVEAWLVENAEPETPTRSVLATREPEPAPEPVSAPAPTNGTVLDQLEQVRRAAERQREQEQSERAEQAFWTEHERAERMQSGPDHSGLAARLAGHSNRAVLVANEAEVAAGIDAALILGEAARAADRAEEELRRRTRESASAPMTSPTTVLVSALDAVGVADAETVMVALRTHLALAGWTLSLRADTV